MMTKKTRLSRFFFIIVASTLILLLAGCKTPEATTPPPTEMPTLAPTSTATKAPTATLKPTDTPEPVIPNTVITLPDGSKIILKPDSKIEILKQVGIPSTSQEIVVKLLQGEILAVSNLKPNKWFTIQNPEGVSARFEGCGAVVSFDATSDAFELKCFAEKCEISTDAIKFSPAMNLFSTIFSKGKLLDPSAFDSAKLKQDYKEDFPECAVLSLPTATATATLPPPAGTPDLAGTATAACATFQQQFPSTPCPK